MRRHIEYSTILNQLFAEKNDVTSAEIKALMPDLPEQTVFSRIRGMERAGLLFRRGRGLYGKGCKPAFKVSTNEKARELSALLIRHFAGAGLCISSGNDNILIETDRNTVDEMTVFLRSNYPNVYSFREGIRLMPLLKGAIIIKPLISDAPVIPFQGSYAPSLEKLLVDLIADEEFYKTNEQETAKEFQRAFEVYSVHKDRLLRYAGRRGVEEEARYLIDHINQSRILTITAIQTLLRDQPVIKAWLFGSWSRFEETEKSDIDLLVSFDPDAHISLMDHAGIQLHLEDGIGIPVDLVTDGTLLPFAEKNVHNEKYLIYERNA